jgi:hypothetical protein
MKDSATAAVLLALLASSMMILGSTAQEVRQYAMNSSATLRIRTYLQQVLAYFNRQVQGTCNACAPACQHIVHALIDGSG